MSLSISQYLYHSVNQSVSRSINWSIGQFYNGTYFHGVMFHGHTLVRYYMNYRHSRVGCNCVIGSLMRSPYLILRVAVQSSKYGFRTQKNKPTAEVMQNRDLWQRKRRRGCHGVKYGPPKLNMHSQVSMKYALHVCIKGC